ncbi:Uncharacterised protein [uncultured Blautia sp.]|nr:Uncharacterised protein [uncultured Blautia sp.]
MEGAHGGLIALVLADDIGEIRLSSSHQDAQLRDDLEVQGVLASLHALQILHNHLHQIVLSFLVF